MANEPEETRLPTLPDGWADGSHNPQQSPPPKWLPHIVPRWQVLLLVIVLMVLANYVGSGAEDITLNQAIVTLVLFPFYATWMWLRLTGRL